MILMNESWGETIKENKRKWEWECEERDGVGWEREWESGKGEKEDGKEKRENGGKSSEILLSCPLTPNKQNDNYTTTILKILR